jgi:hypothetical protein
MNVQQTPLSLALLCRALILTLGALAVPTGTSWAQDVASGTAATDSADRRSSDTGAQIFEQPGVLSPAGSLTIEPSLQYAYSSSNRIALVGYTVIPALLIGVVDVREVKRNTFTATLATRYGITNRLEVEARLPVVRRQDTSIGRRVLDDPAPDQPTAFDASGNDVGDVEATLRYQLNDGGAGVPYFVGSLRVKSRTGRDPFQVVTRTNVPGLGDGVQATLPTGSGFWGVQPGLTMLFPSDPVVFFGSVSLLHSIKRSDVTRQTEAGPELIPGTIQPGRIFGFNFGMGLALNERSSFSLGYDHSSVGKTLQNGVAAPDAVRVQLGTLLLGWSFKTTPKRSINVSLGVGVTRDTPDMTMTVRMPFSL